MMNAVYVLFVSITKILKLTQQFAFVEVTSESENSTSRLAILSTQDGGVVVFEMNTEQVHIHIFCDTFIAPSNRLLIFNNDNYLRKYQIRSFHLLFNFWTSQPKLCIHSDH